MVEKRPRGFLPATWGISRDIRDFLHEINIIVLHQSAVWTTGLLERELCSSAMDHDLMHQMPVVQAHAGLSSALRPAQPGAGLVGGGWIRKGTSTLPGVRAGNYAVSITV